MKRALGFFLAVVLSVNVWPSTVVSAAEISGSQTENLVEESDTTEENEETDETDNKEAGSEEEKEPSLENNEDLNSEDSENSETSENEGNSESTEISENTENEENNDNTETEVTEATEEDQASEDESEEQGFVVTFNSFEGGKYVAYDRQNADEAIVTDDAVSAIARNSDTGEIDTTGSGQVNFSVVLDEGYAFESIEITE